MNYKEKILFNFCKVIIILFTLTSLSACLEKSPEEKKYARKLVSTYSASFKEQAKIQYGKNTNVKKISAGTEILYNAIWPVGEIITNDNLIGIVEVDGESFSAIYNTKSNEIISQKNYEKINESLKQYFSYLNLNIIDSTITDSKYEKYYLPDNINSFEDMLKNKYFFLATVYTTDNLNDIHSESFKGLEEYWKDTPVVGSIVFVQVKDISLVNRIKSIINKIDFSTGYRKVYDYSSNDYVDAFDKYNIDSSISISYSNNKIEYHYMSR